MKSFLYSNKSGFQRQKIIIMRMRRTIQKPLASLCSNCHFSEKFFLKTPQANNNTLVGKRRHATRRIEREREREREQGWTTAARSSTFVPNDRTLLWRKGGGGYPEGMCGMIRHR